VKILSALLSLPKKYKPNPAALENRLETLHPMRVVFTFSWTLDSLRSGTVKDSRESA
jgi:hypothetical protein